MHRLKLLKIKGLYAVSEKELAYLKCIKKIKVKEIKLNTFIFDGIKICTITF